MHTAAQNSQDPPDPEVIQEKEPSTAATVLGSETSSIIRNEIAEKQVEHLQQKCNPDSGGGSTGHTAFEDAVSCSERLLQEECDVSQNGCSEILLAPEKTECTPSIETSQSGQGSVRLMCFASHADKKGTEVSLESVVDKIKNPPEHTKALISEIRAAYSSAGGGKNGKLAIRELKSNLPAVTFSAIGGRRNVDSSNGLIALDVDGLNGRVSVLREQFARDPHVVTVFTSPSGDGLKPVFSLPFLRGTQTDMRRQHRRSFKAVEAYVRRKFGAQADPAASDLLRLCYLSHDPDCSINEHALPLDVDRHFPADDDDPDNCSADPMSKEGCDIRVATPKECVVAALLRSIPQRPDYSEWLKISASVRNSLGSDESAIRLLSAWSPEECCGEYALLLESSPFARIGFGTLVYHAKKHGFNGVIADFFYAGKSGYFMKSANDFIPLTRESDVVNHLRLYGVDPKSEDCPPCRIRSEQYVPFVGEVAGHQMGVHTFNGDKFLVTKGPTIIEARPGDAGFVRDFAVKLLGGSDQPQYRSFLAWLQRARRAVLSGKRDQLPALVVAGDAGDGKSLLLEIVKLSLGGRSASAYKYLSGQTRFNSDLARAELLTVDDDAVAKGRLARTQFAQFIKATLFATSVSVEGKGTNSIQCAPVQALMIAVNSDPPHHLRVLPELDKTVADKIILLKTSASPLPDDLAGNIPLIREKVVDALPGFLKEVDDLDLAEWKNPKTGRLVCHWDEELVRLLRGISPEEQLLELVYAEDLFLQPAADGEEAWRGTANELQNKLTDKIFGCTQTVRSLLSWPGACGTYLSKLADDGTGRVRKLGLTKGTRLQKYWIKAPIQVEECEESPPHFKKKEKEKGGYNSAEELPNPPHTPQREINNAK